MKRKLQGNFQSKRLVEQGFTLVELAIVLVIIGIIIGAVLKGQDLIASARAKKFINWEKQWETAEWTYFDRKGRFAGDSSKNGVIGDSTTAPSEQNASAGTAIYEITNANFVNPPTETITMGSYTFYMKIGYDSSTSNKNIIVVCKADDCATQFSSDELVYVESIDTAIDGTADGGSGNVRAITAAPSMAGTNDVVTAVTESDTANTAWSTSHYALAYYFDKPR